MRVKILCVALILTARVSAQDVHAWEMWMNDVMTAEDVGTAAWEEAYDMLCELEEHPIDLNRATREQLEQLPFLSDSQVEEIVAYLYRYGPMRSTAELQMIRSLDYTRRQLLLCFVYVGEADEEKGFPRLADIAKYGRHELMATARVPLYERQGDREGYQGYPYRHWLKYQLTHGDQVKAGLLGAQDAGEPFFAKRNRWGYDYYSAWLQLRGLGRLETLVAGRYRVSLGMGLVMNGGFSLGKLPMLQSLGRSTSILRAHSSRSTEGFLQGAGATVRIAKGLTATGFISYRGQDATLNSDGSVSTILATGYHRTEREMEKKNNLKLTTFGGSLRYRWQGLHTGLNLVGTHLNRMLSPNTSTLYRRNYATGYDFLNVSADYGYTHPRLQLNGETAVNRRGALATINTLSLRLGDAWSLMALQRFYSYRYTALHANSYSDGGSVQNESGVYLGAAWQPSPRWRVAAYSDYAYFPWAKYRVSLSSHSWDYLLQATFSPGDWTLSARYRLRVKQRDRSATGETSGSSKNAAKTALETRAEHRARLSALWQPQGRWSSRTQIDLGLTAQGEAETGTMLSQQVGYASGWLRLNGGIGLFSTDSYDSRVYAYEQGPLYSYCFTQFSGQGLRYWLMARAAIGKRLVLTAKLGTTDYFDRSTIGTALQQIDASSQTDIDLQVRWKF